jgi:signal transduction histidine kinase
MKIKENMNIFTIRKKILLASKLIGVVLIISYVLSTKLPMDTYISFVIWLAFVVVLVCAIDLLMARFITKPVSELNEAARNMAELNFSHPCHVESHDEFGELAESLNKMAENLQQAFSSLEGANRKLEQDVEQKKRLLAERKELVDNLSHEMKTPLGVIRAYAEGLQDETDEAKRQKYSEVIITETERMSRLITTLYHSHLGKAGTTHSLFCVCLLFRWPHRTEHGVSFRWRQSRHRSYHWQGHYSVLPKRTRAERGRKPLSASQPDHTDTHCRAGRP